MSFSAASSEPGFVLLTGFEEAGGLQWELKLEDSTPVASSNGSVVDSPVHSGSHSYRFNYHFSKDKNLCLTPIPIDHHCFVQDMWGVEFWVKPLGPQNIRFHLKLMEKTGEPWTASTSFIASGTQPQWERIRIPFDAFNLVSWERRNGVLDIEDLKSLQFMITPAGRNKISGSICIDSVRFVSPRFQVTPAQQTKPGFTPVHLDSVFNSDAIALDHNRSDGDFHTGDWEPRTLPAKFFPETEIAELHGVPMLTPPFQDGENNNIRCHGQVLTGFAEQSYSAIYMMASGKFGDQPGNVTLTYDDNTSSKVALQITDWSLDPQYGESVAVKMGHAYHHRKVDNARTPKLFLQSIQVEPDKNLKSIRLPNNDFLKIFGMTLYHGEIPLAVGALEDKPLEELDHRYYLPETIDLDFSEPVVPAGVLGGYLQKRGSAHVLELPTLNGFLTFSSEARYLPQHSMDWHLFHPNGRHFQLGGFQVDHDEDEIPIKMDFIDSTCLKYSCEAVIENKEVPFAVYLSRAWPAALYEIGTPDFYWSSSLKGNTPYFTYVSDGVVQSVSFDCVTSLPVPDEPWILVWQKVPPTNKIVNHFVGSMRDFSSPMLLVLEKKPEKIELVKNLKDAELRLYLRGAQGRVAAMPLYGIKRLDTSITSQWAKDGIPEKVVDQSRNWSQRVQRFPLKLQQDFTVSEDEKWVSQQDHFEWLELDSDWETPTQKFTPFPPTVFLAKDNGYPVQVPDKIQETEVSTFYGPLVGVSDSQTSYTMPVSPYTKSMVSFTDSQGGELLEEIKADFSRTLGEKIPKNLDECHYISDVTGDLSDMRLVAPSYLMIGHDKQREEYCRQVVRNALKDHNLKLEKEPQTSQYFLMDDRFWAKDAAYDKEWSIGFFLQGLWSEAYYLQDWDVIEENWNKIRGLYRYYQIIFDWTTNATFTMTTGNGANSDGSRIAYDGMLAFARMADQIGDQEAFHDALARSSRQRLSLYASWYAAQWAADHDYVMAQYKHIPADKAELNFSPDHIWTEFHTTNTSHPKEDFFQTIHALYVFNLANLMFLHDTGLAESRLRKWLLEEMPKIHPDWDNGNIRPNKHARYYGDGSAMTHIMARAFLFNHDLAESWKSIKKATDDTVVLNKWYGPAPMMPMTLGAMITASAPLVIVPVNAVYIEKSKYDQDKKKHQIVLKPYKDGQFQLRLHYWDTPPTTVSINGKKVEFQLDKSRHDVAIPFNATSGKKITITVNFREM